MREAIERGLGMAWYARVMSDRTCTHANLRLAAALGL